MNRTYFFAAIALAVAFDGSAYAQCPGAKTAMKTAPRLQLNSALANQPAALARAQAASPQADASLSIAGLWETLSFSGGELVDDAFDVFYADGMELLNDASPILYGNICVGIWTQTGPRTFQLHHVSWVFDETGNPIAKNISELAITLDPTGQTFTANATYVNYDLDGTKITAGPGAPGSFTVTGTRITMPASSSTHAVANPKSTTTILREAVLDGTQSTSADGKPLTYFWSLSKGSLPAAISKGDTAMPLVTFGAGKGPYMFTLTVTDSAGTTSTDTLTVNFAGI